MTEILQFYYKPIPSYEQYFHRMKVITILTICHIKFVDYCLLMGDEV